MLRLALEVADRIVAVLPAGAAYALADFAGDLWYRLAPERRRLVAANLARVCAATGRPTRGPEFAALVHSAFRNHARYYVELLRAPHYPIDRIDEHVDVPDWDRFLPLLQHGPAMLLSSHLGNFEPFGTVIAAQGLRPLSPVEEIEPRGAVRVRLRATGASQVDLVPLGEAARAIVKRLRSGGIVGIIADRDLAGDGQPVTMFGHPTTLSPGPAALAVAHRANLIVGRCLRVGPDRFIAEGDILEVPNSGDRRADTRALVERIAATLRARHRRGAGAVVGRLPAVLAGPAAMTQERRRARQGRHAPPHAVLGRDRIGAGGARPRRASHRSRPHRDHRPRADRRSPARRARSMPPATTRSASSSARRSRPVAATCSRSSSASGSPRCGRWRRRSSASTTRAASRSRRTRWRRSPRRSAAPRWSAATRPILATGSTRSS